MNFISRIQSFFSYKNNDYATSTASQFECPNCWGRQQWDGVDRPATADLQKDTSAIGRSRDGFIRRFTNRHLHRRTQ